MYLSKCYDFSREDTSTRVLLASASNDTDLIRNRIMLL